jgi:uncharacterized membrane protein (DUF485 family)
MTEPVPPAQAKQRTDLGAGLALLVAAGYYGFLLAGALAPQALARPAIGHVPWSFVLGAGLLVGAIVATGLYVLLANAADDRAELRA